MGFIHLNAASYPSPIILAAKKLSIVLEGVARQLYLLLEDQVIRLSWRICDWLEARRIQRLTGPNAETSELRSWETPKMTDQEYANNSNSND
uniref:Uncharacterized protein n=1 Tax=Anopheles albimanus TaxID=7167 RepID=A0A182FWU8_ANOAL